MRIWVVVAFAWSLTAPALAQSVLPKQSQVEGKLREEAGRLIADAPAKIDVPLDEADRIVLRVKTGKDLAGLSATFKGKEGAPVGLAIRPRELRLPKDRVFRDAYLELSWGATRLFVRPNAEFYNEQRLRELTKQWDELPPASDHVVTLELRRAAQGWEAWADGRFVSNVPVKGPLTGAELRLPAGASIHGMEAGREKASRRRSIALEHFTRPGAMRGARIALTADRDTLDGIAVPAAANAANVDVGGLGRVPARSDDLVSLAWRRGALDGLPEACLFRIPQAVYSHALLLCAAEEDAARVPAFTLRLTRYGTSRGDALADTVVRLPRPGSTTPEARPVGNVSYGPENARKTVPLWLVRVPLKNGVIQDLIDEGVKTPARRYLDLELLDPLERVEEYDAFPPSTKPTGRTYAPTAARSSVHVFGLSLEQSPASMVVRASLPVRVFYAADKPEWRATVKGVPGDYRVSWDFADVDGKIAASGKQSFTLSAEEPEKTVAVPAEVGPGWYASRFRLVDKGGVERLDHRASFVMLPPDTRKAGFESPHGAWWFHYAHGGEPNIERVGPVLQRAGLRHTTLPKTLPEAITAKYGVTEWNVHWFHSRKPTLEEKITDHEQHIRESLKRWPSLDRILVFHESGGLGAPFPSELWGQTPPQPSENVERAWKNRLEYATALAKMVRAKFPKLKLQYGNDGTGLHLVGGLLRHKFPRAYCDAFAVEDLGQTIITEKPIPNGLQSTWYLRQVAREFGYGDVPVNACYEWMGRRDLVLGTATQAEWYVRDALHARAYGFASIAIGTVHDAGNGYFHSLWGGGGLCRRYPDMDPKPSYAALATVTRVLDGASYQRTVPTGSLSLYAVEFKRGDDWVYAVWAPRGRREATLRFAEAGPVARIDLYGRETALVGPKLALNASTAAQYLLSKSRLQEVSAGRSSFPDDPPPTGAFVVDELDSLSHVTLAEGKDKRLERTSGEHMPHRTRGHFELREVKDEEKGKCLELELKAEGETWAAMHEYAFLKLKEPVSAPRSCDRVGVWIKGNSGWGDVMWEVRNAKGETWLSQGIYMDWPGTIATNFDGWNFLRLELPKGPQWRTQIKVTGLIVTVPRQALYLTEMVPVREKKIRLKGLSLFNRQQP